MQKLKAQKGITLIALIITIIVMLILVGVSVTVALNGGLFSQAQQAVGETETERDKELALSDGRVKVNGVWYDSMDDYVANKPSENQSESSTEGGSGNEGTGGEEPEVVLPEGWSVAEIKPEGWSENVEAITDGANTIPLPKGFEISTKGTEDEISEGLVIKDGANEFVWIPVTDAVSYTEDSFGPLTGTHSTTTYIYDSQEELNYYYGMKEDGTTPYYNYADFTYETDKTNVETSIQTYGGFYVGRYETTIDENTIGVQQGKEVLTSATLLKEGTNETSNDEYHYRWWGLYKAQKDMYANNTSVGSLMISSKQWDEIMTFTGYGSSKRTTDTYTSKPDLSGSAYATDSTQYDVSKNIYDLAGNVYEFTLNVNGTTSRTSRGGSYNDSIDSAYYSRVYSPLNSLTYYRF